MVNHETVLHAFASQSPVNKDGGTLAYYCLKIYSYQLLVGEWKPHPVNDNTFICLIYNHTAQGGHFVSRTTSTHVSKINNDLLEHDVMFSDVEIM